MALTNYVVLRVDDESSSLFKKISETEAASAETAIKHALSNSEGNPAGGFYVAVPSRSFQVVPVSIKIVQPQIVIGGEKAEIAPPELKKFVEVIPDDEPSFDKPVAATVIQV